MPRLAHIALVLPLLLVAANLRAEVVRSPDGKVSLHIDTVDGALRYHIEREAKPVIEPSALGITVDGKSLGTNATVGQSKTSSINETYTVHGVHAKAINKSNDISIPITTDAVAWTLEARVFDDGVAYRYIVPGIGKRVVLGEASEWKLPENTRMWFMPNSYDKNYEARFQGISNARYIPVGNVFSAPATIQLPDNGPYAVLTEANLENYTDMGLQVLDRSRFGAVLHNSVKGFELEGTITTPWRVTLISPDLNGLVNSDIVRSLNPPSNPGLENAAWIKTGRAAWHWRVTGRPKFEEQKQWIDWTSELGFEFYLIDDGWRDWKEGERDAWAMMKELVDYAKTKNVAIWAWAHSNELSDGPSREAYMTKAHDLGIVGLKIDFMDPADVAWTKWYSGTQRDAAKFQLMLNFHGALKPTGQERTFPHELTREAIFGREQGKLPGFHDTTLPFARYVQGAADYTPTDFRPTELKGNSVAKELAQAIVYTSPFLCYSGDPRDYLKSETVDVIKAIPATWDETIVLPGSQIGEVAAFARRKGDQWFIGIINGEKAQNFDIALSFLGDGKFSAETLGDSIVSNERFERNRETVEKSKSLKFPLRSDGGAVVWLKPTK